MRKILFLMTFATAAWAQAPIITSFTTDIPGVTTIGPGTEIYILGTFVLHSAGRDYTITVGGQTGGINVADGTDFISATIPATTPAGATTLVVTYQGQAIQCHSDHHRCTPAPARRSRGAHFLSDGSSAI